MAGHKTRQKLAGAYFTPPHVAVSLVRWAISNKNDRLLDPSCGDGQFISRHRNSVGIEQDASTAHAAMERAPWALVHEGDFFSWASETQERFECVAGNPPFIRYQTFAGDVRSRAATVCRKLGVEFSGLASSWAPFLVAAASLLKRGGRMAFVVPAEIGHAPYAKPLLQFLVGNFSFVQVIAIRKKLFPDLSEDCWLLYADEYGSDTNEIAFTVTEAFVPSDTPPRITRRIPVSELDSVWAWRLRPYILSESNRGAYVNLKAQPDVVMLGDIASVGIGYVTGANDFFHLKPSQAKRHGIPANFLQTTVRNGRALPKGSLSESVVHGWLADDEPVLLLRLPKTADLPPQIRRYLETEDAREASAAYKCRKRDPWYSVPDVNVPDYFLTYMSGVTPSLARNDANCSCTNSVHSVRLRSPKFKSYLAGWNSDRVQLSAELEGHPLGGGMLKLEPREANRIILSSLDHPPSVLFSDAIADLRAWRHHV